jgi:hypothetical protein
MELNFLTNQSAAPAVVPAIPAAPSSSDVAAFNNLMNSTTAQTPMVQTAMGMLISEFIEGKQTIVEKEVRGKQEVEKEVIKEVIEVQHVEKHDEVNNGLQTAAKISNA